MISVNAWIKYYSFKTHEHIHSDIPEQNNHMLDLYHFWFIKKQHRENSFYFQFR